jgi:hypothetical protein
VLRYKIQKRPREMGLLGSLQAFNLWEARERAKKARQLLADGIDPIERRTETSAAAATATRKAANVLTFGKAADQYIEAHEASWRNVKHGVQWRQTIDAYAKLVIGNLPVAAIDTDLVLQVLRLRCPQPS